MITEQDCIEALREATEQMGRAPTRSEYEDLGVLPSASSIMRIVGGWNEAKELAGIETYGFGHFSGFPPDPKPDYVDLPEDKEWEELSGNMRYYYKNRRAEIERKEARRRELRRWLYEYKRDECECKRCGEDHAACLDFHHVGEKKDGISRLANRGFSIENILSEIEKCEVLCSNCHRREHLSVPRLVQEGSNRDK